MYQGTGLTQAEIDERVSSGQINVTDDTKGRKTVGQIILSNSLTFFNILNVIFFILIISVRSFKNCIFIWTILVNTIIGIVQEIRTKKTLDALQIMTESKARALRESEIREIPVTELVLDDVILLKAGDQIPADAVVLDGEIEVNESMLTGESDNIMKKTDMEVFSGAFVTSGSAVCRVIHVGQDNYIETISGEAKKFKKVNSELRNYINKILRVVSFFIVPLCAGLFCKMYFLNKSTFRSAIEQMVTSGIGMIPEGLFVLTSISLTLGVLRLAQKKTIVQELYCIETLARVDVLCLDKTGTLTEGRIRVEQAASLEENVSLDLPVQNLLASMDSMNATAEGMLEYFGSPDAAWTVKKTIPFSSERKYSGASFEGKGTYYMGALQYLLPNDRELAGIVAPYASRGLRVIVLAHSDSYPEGYGLPSDLRAIGYVLMSDVIRRDCAETIAFFKEQGVELKVISGDDPLTVSKIALKCGVENAEYYIDASTVSDEDMPEAVRKYTVFGRVKPEQKKLMVQCLKQQGRTVAMTGDGVNDVLALKEADCSIAMASGADAAKNVSNILLLNSDFSSMPSIVKEGRRVINNICNAAAMYLIKTTFSVILTFGTLLIGYSYPFQAVQLSIISGCAVGIPTFLLQMEPSFKQIKEHFMRTVLRNAVPPGIVIGIVCLLITNVGMAIDMSNQPMLSTINVFCIGWIYFFMLRKIYSPLTPFRKAVTYTMEVIYLIVMCIGHHILELVNVTPILVTILIGVITVSPILIDLLQGSFDVTMSRLEKKKQEKKTRGGKKVSHAAG